MEDIRWVQRFDNYEKAIGKIFEVTKSNRTIEDLSELEKEGLVQRFEYTFELAWKTLQDYLLYLGFQYQPGPNPTIQGCFENGIIANYDGWRRMLQARNIASHTYNEDDALEIVTSIFFEYSKLLEDLYQSLSLVKLDLISKNNI